MCAMAAIASLSHECTPMILHLAAAVWLQACTIALAESICRHGRPRSPRRLAVVDENGGAMGVEVPIWADV